MKVTAFAASSSKKSINKQLVIYAASLLKGAEIEVLDLNDYELPLFSVDKEEELGVPSPARNFLQKLQHTDAVVISFAEHNGSYTAAYKNLLDWLSRIEREIFQNKPAVFLATSPGAKGGAGVLDTALASARFFGADVRSSLSIPLFAENYDVVAQRICNEEYNERLVHVMNSIG